MIDFILSASGFAALLAIFAVGAIGSLLVQGRDRLANAWGSGCAIAGSAYGALWSAAYLATGQVTDVKFSLIDDRIFNLSMHVDRLAALFVMIISIVALFASIYAVGYVRSFYQRYSVGLLGFLYNLFIVGMVLVVTASNVIVFMMAWEVMSLASYFMVVYDRNDRRNIKAGFLYFIMTHIGAACLLLAFVLLAHNAGSFDFEAMRAHAGQLPDIAKLAVFILALAGLGVKAGVVPLHIWLPSAHPAAPSHVSALMSGVMIKMGIYMMVRLFLDILQPLPIWMGEVVLVLGAVSALLGVLYALTEHDLKRLLAYHSIENIGIILLGLGSAMIFGSIDQPELEMLALTATLFHTFNHALFKSLLFLGAGSVIHGTKSRNIEDYGGLLKLMPVTGLLFLIGSMAISALPPFNGFYSEWATFQSLFGGIAVADGYVKWMFVAAVASLGLTGGLALACFVKAFGATFLARPRSNHAKQAHESSNWMQLGMAGIAALCIAVGVVAAPVVVVLQDVSRTATGQPSVGSAIVVSDSFTVASDHSSSSVSGVVVAALLVAVIVGVWGVSKYGVYRKQQVTIGDTWGCGTPMTSRMEITATGFSRSIVTVFRGVLRPKLKFDVRYAETANRYAPISRSVSVKIADVYRGRVYDPIYNLLLKTSFQIKRIQNGSLSAYVLYILVTLVAVLAVESIR